MTNSRESGSLVLYRELGPSSRYLTLPGEALLASYQRNDIELAELAVRLAKLVEGIPYDNDRFDILIAPLADLIDKRLYDGWPFGKIVEVKVISRYVDLQLYRQRQSGYWVRLISDIRVPFSAYDEIKKRKTERILDESVGLRKLKRKEIRAGNEGPQDFGSTYYFVDLSGETVVKESSWVHDFGEEIRFSKSYFFSGKEQTRRVWESIVGVVA